jgi:hypothetical protein
VRLSADVADLDAISIKFTGNEPVRMSSFERCTNGGIDLGVFISLISIAKDHAWLRSKSRQRQLQLRFPLPQAASRLPPRPAAD